MVLRPRYRGAVSDNSAVQGHTPEGGTNSAPGSVRVCCEWPGPPPHTRRQSVGADEVWLVICEVTGAVVAGAAGTIRTQAQETWWIDTETCPRAPADGAGDQVLTSVGTSVTHGAGRHVDGVAGLPGRWKGVCSDYLGCCTVFRQKRAVRRLSSQVCVNMTWCSDYVLPTQCITMPTCCWLLSVTVL